MDIQLRLKSGSESTSSALELFDSLEPVELEMMTGQWKGEGLATNHPMDGLLETFHWYGKRFENPDQVHPLVFTKLWGRLASVNPFYMIPSLHFSIPKLRVLGRLFQFFIPLLSTSSSKARLRMMLYREKVSATMIYDQLPINDVFIKN